jgi:CBS domain-containing protein
LDAEKLEQPIARLKVREPVCVSPSTTVRDVVKLLQERRAGCVMVTEGKRLVGIFTDRDALRRFAPFGKAAGGTPISDLMTPHPVSLRPDDSILFAMNRMHEGGYRHVPLVNEANVPVGIISVRAVVDYIVEHFEDELLSESR